MPTYRGNGDSAWTAETSASEATPFFERLCPAVTAATRVSDMARTKSFKVLVVHNVKTDKKFAEAFLREAP